MFIVFVYSEIDLILPNKSSVLHFSLDCLTLFCFRIIIIKNYFILIRRIFMDVGAKLKFFREKRELSTNKLSDLTGISQSTISKLENGKRKADLDTLLKIAEALNIPVTAFTGESLSCLIENRLEKIGMSLEELSKKACVSLTFLKNLDDVIPDPLDYDSVTKIAKVLKMPSSILRNALSIQEPPVYEGLSSTAGEDFDIIEEDSEKFIYLKAKEIAAKGGFTLIFDRLTRTDGSEFYNLLTLENHKDNNTWHMVVHPRKFCEWIINVEKKCDEYKKQMLHEKIKDLEQFQLLTSDKE